MLKSLRALAVFVGTIIGVGIFGLPYIASRTGFLPLVLYFLFIPGIVILINLFIAEIALGTEKLHRLPGYAAEYLGPCWGKICLIITGLGLFGALLAYLIVGGEFLFFLLSPLWGGDRLLYSLLFFVFGVFFIFRGSKSVSRLELPLFFVLFAILIVFFIRAFPFINLEHLKTMNWRFATFPYGAVIFSLWGAAIIPEIKEMLDNDKTKIKRVIISGVLLSAAAYLFFVFTILGASGLQASKEAISGFARALGDNIIGLGFIFGVITCFTSFITLGLTLKKVFWYDFNFSKGLSWLIACFVPLFLFLAGAREFIDIIGLTGALALGAEAIIIVLVYREFLKKQGLSKGRNLVCLLPVFFVLGMIFEIFYLVVR